MTKQVFVAAWLGLVVGWVGFGLALADAPRETGHVAAVWHGRL